MDIPHADIPTRQTEKYHLAMAGEFFVAAQLQRLGLLASITYGNAKSADVVVFKDGSDRVVVIEVKTTKQPQWTFGGRISTESKKPWVFVQLPEDCDQPPKFFVLTQSELFAILAPLDEEWCAGFKAKHGREFDEKSWVTNISSKLLQDNGHENKWGAIIDQLHS
jgi:hypothetical protein